MSIQSAETVNVLDNTSELAVRAVDTIYIKKFWRKEGIYVSISKYSGVNEALKWVKGYHKAVDGFVYQNYKIDQTKLGAGRVDLSKYLSLRQEAGTVVDNDNSYIIIEKMKINLEKEIDKKIAANTKTRQLIQNIRENERDINSVNLKNVAVYTYKELGIPTQILSYISEVSKVAPNYFAGFSDIPEYPNLEYDSDKNRSIEAKQQNPKVSNTSERHDIFKKNEKKILNR
jgi:hypothetical protein